MKYEELVTIAERLDKIAKETDPYEYSDNDCSVETALRDILYTPHEVIRWLIDRIEETEE